MSSSSSSSSSPPPAETTTTANVLKTHRRRTWATTAVIVAAGLVGVAALLVVTLQDNGSVEEPVLVEGESLRGTVEPPPLPTIDLPSGEEAVEGEEEEERPLEINLPNIPHAEEEEEASIDIFDRTFSVASTTSLILRDLPAGRTIPTELGRFTNLQELSLSQNSLKGSLPTHLGLLTKLTRLAIMNATLTGNIPSEVGLLTQLTALRLDRNALTGSLPRELQALTDLQGLYVHYNQLTGSLPPLDVSQQLYAYHNDLSGSVPRSVCRWLQGSLKECFVDATKVDTSGCSACSDCVGPYC